MVGSLRRVRELDWNSLYRAIAFRDGEYLRIVSLHVDHDSAYER